MYTYALTVWGGSVVVQVASFASVQGRWKGGFVCFCAGKVIRAAERDSGSDPLLPVLAQEGQTPCRTVHLNGHRLATTAKWNTRGSTRRAMKNSTLARGNLTKSGTKSHSGRKDGGQQV